MLTLVSYAGHTRIVIFIAWLITLITGKLPAPLHLAFTAVLRFQTRYYCYMGLLTSTYPWKLFGDEPSVSAPVIERLPDGAADPERRDRDARRFGLGHPARSTRPRLPTGRRPRTAAPRLRHPLRLRHCPGLRHFPAPSTARRPVRQRPASLRPASWPLVLPSAKNLLILFIVLGLID